MKKLTDNIPNGITLLNLLSGALSVIISLSGDLALAAWLILIAGLFDFLDGFIARLLDAKSPIGGQLDSLADVVSFGLAPALILFRLLQESQGWPDFTAGNIQLMPYIALLILITAAYRLALFNIDSGQEYRFSGLPTPATGLFVASLPLILEQFGENDTIVSLVRNPYILLGVVIIFSLLMVSAIPMIAMKFRNYSWKENKYRYLLIIISPLLVFFIQSLGLAIIILLYIVLSVLDWLTVQGSIKAGRNKVTG